MNYINNRGPIITVQDPLRPGRYIQYRDLNWQGMPEIISFTDYLRWNYTLDYGSFIRKLHEINELPLSYNISAKSKVTNVTIVDGKYDRIDSTSFLMFVICDVGFSCAGYECHQQYCVSGYFRTYGVAFGLTEYAKHHMAECCLSFKRIYGKQEYSYTYGELNKEDLSLIVEHTLDNEQKKKLRKALKEHSKEDIKLQSNSGSNPFAEAVKFHMKRCKVTVETLAERSGLGLTTIGRMRKGGKFKIETILAFSVALELEMPFIVDLMQKAGVQFDPHNAVHNMYLTILDLLPDANVFQINAFLKEEGFTPWTQERESQIEKEVI